MEGWINIKSVRKLQCDVVPGKSPVAGHAQYTLSVEEVGFLRVVKMENICDLSEGTISAFAWRD
jgi:hypothetical protein